MSVAASLGFLAGLGSEPIDRGMVIALLAGGIAVAPLAAWLVRRLHVEVSGTLVGAVVIVTNARTLLKEGGIAADDRAWYLAALVLAGAALVGRSHFVARRRVAVLAVV